MPKLEAIVEFRAAAFHRHPIKRYSSGMRRGSASRWPRTSTRTCIVDEVLAVGDQYIKEMYQRHARSWWGDAP